MNLEEERLKYDLQEVSVFCTCNDCGSEIYFGNEYYEDDTGDILCEDCFDKKQHEEKQEKYRIAGEG